MSILVNESNSNNNKLASIGVEMTESMTTSSLMQFNRDVESMLEHGALRAAMNDIQQTPHCAAKSPSSKESSEEPSAYEEPKEDFTQHFQ